MAKVMKKEFDPKQAGYGRFGPPTHLSAKEKRERKLTHLDKAELVGGGAFSGKVDEKPIPADIAKTFAEYYEKHF